mgnify:CR=1 FL=1
MTLWRTSGLARPRFTQRLLEIVYPQFLAPTPSMLIAMLQPELGDPALAAGVTVPRGSVRSLVSGLPVAPLRRMPWQPAQRSK